LAKPAQPIHEVPSIANAIDMGFSFAARVDILALPPVRR
jgi:hypothetical protein